MHLKNVLPFTAKASQEEVKRHEFDLLLKYLISDNTYDITFACDTTPHTQLEWAAITIKNLIAIKELIDITDQKRSKLTISELTIPYYDIVREWEDSDVNYDLRFELRQPNVWIIYGMHAYQITEEMRPVWSNVLGTVIAITSQTLEDLAPQFEIYYDKINELHTRRNQLNEQLLEAISDIHNADNQFYTEACRHLEDLFKNAGGNVLLANLL